MGWITVCQGIKGKLKKGQERDGVGIDGYLKANLDGIPSFLKKGYDCVGIISGMSKVRIGKCLKKGSKVLMSDGSWKLVEDVKIGDEVISPQLDGSSTYEKVTNLHNRFEEDCYDIIEESTGKLLYSCAGNHEVPVYKNNLTKGKYEYNIIEAKDLSNFSIKSKNQFYCEKYSDNIEFKSKNPNINPYVLGVWLGDGSFSSIRRLRIDGKGCKGNWLSRNLNITSNNEDIIDEVSKYYKIIKIHSKKNTSAKIYRFSLNGDLSKQLSKLNLEGKNSETKFIPKECLTASRYFRLNLLAGLIDTDGYVNKNNSISITTKSRQLSNDISYLTNSLGGSSSIRKIKKCIKELNFVGEYYNVKISFTDNSIIPIKVKYKLERTSNSKFNRNHVYIKCIKSSPSEVYGFSLTGNSKLHITDNWMVTHNSTLAIGTVGSYIAWILAGGRVKCHQEVKDNKEIWKIDSVKLPTRNINWNLKENVCFSAEDLQNTAFKLYKKYGKGQVIVYDEGRQGLDSARAMESINKGMEDFFQTCGFMGHVILIVLPNFFKLHEDYAVARSLFLINVYADKNYNRGYFSFYNEIQKEKLFYFGKKRIGVRAKYTSASHNFWGKFSSWFPFDKDEYEKLKEEAMKKARLKKSNIKYKKQRDICMYLLKKHAEMSSIDISREISVISDSKISERMVRYAISGITKEKAQDIE